LEYERTVVDGRELCRETMLEGRYVFGSPTSLMYRSDLLRKTKAFYPNSNPHSDTSACYASLAECDFGFVHQLLSYTRVHAATQTSNSMKTGKINRSLINDVVTYGPLFLSPDELKEALNDRLDHYYDWLISALIENSFSAKFLEAQREGLKEVGQDLSEARLAKAALNVGKSLLQHPRTTLKKLSILNKTKGKVEARYY
jgi:hypothetical protein